jgi:putative transposase
MARTARLVAPGVPHHVYLRGNNRRRLFSTRADRVRWIGCVARALEATSCALHQTTLMTNHVHLIVTPPSKAALAQLMKRSCQRYAQLRNAAKDTSGKLFEERYRSKVIEDEAHLMTVTLYNDANAFRAGLVDDALDHEWSTGPLHAGREGSQVASLWTPSTWYLRLGATTAARATAYVALMEAYTRAPLHETCRPIAAQLELGAYARRIERPDGTCAREAALRSR